MAGCPSQARCAQNSQLAALLIELTAQRRRDHAIIAPFWFWDFFGIVFGTFHKRNRGRILAFEPLYEWICLDWRREGRCAWGIFEKWSQEEAAKGHVASTFDAFLVKRRSRHAEDPVLTLAANFIQSLSPIFRYLYIPLLSRSFMHLDKRRDPDWSSESLMIRSSWNNSIKFLSSRQILEFQKTTVFCLQILYPKWASEKGTFSNGDNSCSHSSICPRGCDTHTKCLVCLFAFVFAYLPIAIWFLSGENLFTVWHLIA